MAMNNPHTVFTIGHSTHGIDSFLRLLFNYNINCVIDVRSTPYSRIAPQFNKSELSKSLKMHDILYAHFGKEFGARHTDQALLDDDGIVDFAKVRKSEVFNDGMKRLQNALLQDYTIALMCSEANPFDCHRFSMISYQLIQEGMSVIHILKNSRILENSILEDWLLKKYHRKLPQNTLFEGIVTIETQIEAAYKLRNKDIGFSQETETEREVW